MIKGLIIGVFIGMVLTTLFFIFTIHSIFIDTYDHYIAIDTIWKIIDFTYFPILE